MVNVFVFDVAELLLNVATTLTVWPAKFAPKSNFACVVKGKVNMLSPSWFVPVTFNISPTEPVPPEPVAKIETV